MIIIRRPREKVSCFYFLPFYAIIILAGNIIENMKWEELKKQVITEYVSVRHKEERSCL